MPRIGIEFSTTREDAESRVALEGEGEVTGDGNYYREEVVSINMYQHLRDCAEEDDEATITKVEL